MCKRNFWGRLNFFGWKGNLTKKSIQTSKKMTNQQKKRVLVPYSILAFVQFHVLYNRNMAAPLPRQNAEKHHGAEDKNSDDRDREFVQFFRHCDRMNVQCILYRANINTLHA